MKMTVRECWEYGSFVGDCCCCKIDYTEWDNMESNLKGQNEKLFFG